MWKPHHNSPFPYIYNWEDICGHFAGTIIIGNGASIAVNPQFNYRSLLEHATRKGSLSKDVEKIFDSFNTSDFELVLRLLWQSENMNKALGILDTRTSTAYVEVRQRLIEAVRAIHPERATIQHHLPQIYNFLKRFKTVVSLNYDLIIYWAMMQGNSEEATHAFKDCFIRGNFKDAWQELRKPYQSIKSSTLVFYPHGNLILAKNITEGEIKLSSRGPQLLESVLESWESGKYLPLFISEGTTVKKIDAVQRSHYLDSVFREVLSQPTPNLVIYGWGMGEQDSHILKKMSASPYWPTNIAISVYNREANYCHHAEYSIRNVFGPKPDILFFDSSSPSCWIYQ